MNSQVNIKIDSDFLRKAEMYAKVKGYLNVQEMIRQLLREAVLDEVGDSFSGSIASFGKEWLSKEDDEAFAHLQ
jgi:hypothetical protein